MRRRKTLFADEFGVRPWAMIAAVLAVCAVCILAVLALASSACGQVTFNPGNPQYHSPVNPGNPMNYQPGGVYGPPAEGSSGGGC